MRVGLVNFEVLLVGVVGEGGSVEGSLVGGCLGFDMGGVGVFDLWGLVLGNVLV